MTGADHHYFEMFVEFLHGLVRTPRNGKSVTASIVATFFSGYVGVERTLLSASHTTALIICTTAAAD